MQTETVVVSCQRNLAFAGGVVPSGGVEVWTLETMAVNWLGKGVCFLSSLGGGVGWSQRVLIFSAFCCRVATWYGCFLLVDEPIFSLNRLVF